MGHAPTVRSTTQDSSYIRAPEYYAVHRGEWLASTTASSSKGGRPTRTPNLAYRSSSLSLLRGGRPEDTAVLPGGSTTTPLAGVSVLKYKSTLVL